MTGSSTLGIGLTMFLRDQFSGPASRIRNSNKALQQDMRRMQEEQLRYQRNVNAGVALMGAAATRGIARAVTESAKFGYEMEFVKSVTSATRTEADLLGRQAMRLGQDTMFFAQDVAEGMRYMAMAGMSAQEVKANISGAVNLAGATKSLLGGKGGAADIMTNIMKQFQISFQYTNDVADILAYGTTRANTNLFDLGEALKYAGATSMDLNISLQESVAMAMALGNAGMQGSMAGVAMENAMRYMTRAFSDFGSGTSRKALEMIGLTIKDVTDEKGNLISMTEVMKKMGYAIDRMYGSGMNIQKQSILQAIFGVRGKRAASLFLRNLQEFDQFTGDISSKSGGHATRIMEDMMATLQGQILRTGSAWKNMWIKFTEAVSPAVIFVLNIAEKLFTGLQKLFEIPYLGQALAYGITGFIVITTAAAAFRSVVAGFKLIYMNSGLAFNTLKNSKVAGFTQMTTAANMYSGALDRISLKEMAAAGRIKGVGVNAAGRLISTKTNKFISYAGAGAVAGGAARVAGGRVVANSALRMGLGRLVSFLGGPWMLALSFILPAALGLLTRALSSNKDSVEKNTNALSQTPGKNSDMVYSSEFVPMQMGPRILALQQMGNRNIHEAMIGSGFEGAVERALSKITTMNGKGDIIINLDGNTVFRSPLDSLRGDFRSIGIYE